MNVLSTLLASAPKYVIYVLIALSLMFGSHAGLDYLAATFGDSCIPLDTDTSVCLVKDTAE